MFDKRGWNLLHLAAASGSEEMISHLLSLGLDPRALSDPATFMLPEELDNKSLTPRKIAEHYRHGKIYDDTLRAAGLSDHTSNVEQSEEIEEKLVELG
jgi:ankyrin repeat protein